MSDFSLPPSSFFSCQWFPHKFKSRTLCACAWSKLGLPGCFDSWMELKMETMVNGQLVIFWVSEFENVFCPSLLLCSLPGSFSLGCLHQPQGKESQDSSETQIYILSSQVTASSYTPSDSQVWSLLSKFPFLMI